MDTISFVSYDALLLDGHECPCSFRTLSYLADCRQRLAWRRLVIRLLLTAVVDQRHLDLRLIASVLVLVLNGTSLLGLLGVVLILAIAAIVRSTALPQLTEPLDKLLPVLRQATGVYVRVNRTGADIGNREVLETSKQTWRRLLAGQTSVLTVVVVQTSVPRGVVGGRRSAEKKSDGGGVGKRPPTKGYVLAVNSGIVPGMKGEAAVASSGSFAEVVREVLRRRNVVGRRHGDVLPHVGRVVVVRQSLVVVVVPGVLQEALLLVLLSCSGSLSLVALWNRGEGCASRLEDVLGRHPVSLELGPTNMNGDRVRLGVSCINSRCTGREVAQERATSLLSCLRSRGRGRGRAGPIVGRLRCGLPGFSSTLCLVCGLRKSGKQREEPEGGLAESAGLAGRTAVRVALESVASTSTTLPW